MTRVEKTTNNIQTIPMDRVVADQTTDDYGLFRKDRVISTISPIVVRQDGAGGPKYQEAIGYHFLVNNCKFPGLARMDDGTLVLTLWASLRPPDNTPSEPILPRKEFATAEEVWQWLITEKSKGDSRWPLRDTGLILFSKDEGMSWSSPRRIPFQRCKPINLGGKNLMLLGGCEGFSDRMGLGLSDDAGQTFGSPIQLPDLADGSPTYTDVPLTHLVEKGKVTFLFYVALKDKELIRQGITAQSLLRRFDPQTKQWGEPQLFPASWRTSEGSLTRADDGALVAAFRTFRPGVPAPSDHWRGILTSRSTDDGRSWSEPNIHFLYGHHHQSLLKLPDGRILMTYAARIGELEGRTYHGVEAVVSRDHGITWHWENRYILFRGSMDQAMGHAQSVRLSDGRILTVLLDHTTYSWCDYADGDRSSHAVHLGQVPAVIWSL